MDLNSSQTPHEDLWSIKNIERLSLGLGIILFVGAIFLKPTFQVVFGVFSGVFVGWFNFKLLGRFVTKLVAKAESGVGKNGAAVLLKMLLLLVVVGVLILVVKINPISFVLGFSCVILAIFIEGLRHLF